MSRSLDRIGAALAGSIGLICIAPMSVQAQGYYSEPRYQSYPRYQQVAPDDDDDVVILPDRPFFAPRPPTMIPDRPVPLPDRGYVPLQRMAPQPSMAIPNQRYVPNERYVPRDQYVPNDRYAPDQRYIPDQRSTIPNQRYVPDQVPDQQTVAPQDEPTDETAVLPPQFRRQVVAYPSREPRGTIVIDTPHAHLYYVLGDGSAIRYGIGVGREGFTWSGVRTIDRKQEWPDWHPPAEMIARQPYLPRFMAGGPGNPLGARAMYLKGTLFRIHGTSEPNTIGKHVSSGCIRMLNADAIDLYNRTPLGTKVVVLPDSYRPRNNEAVVRPQRQSALTTTPR